MAETTVGIKATKSVYIMLTQAVRRNSREPWHGHAINGFIRDTSDASFARQFTIERPLPGSPYSRTHGQRGLPELSIRTSMQVSGSDHTRQSSLPALSFTATRTESDIPSSVGRRQLEQEQRILEPGPDGTLQVTVPPRRPLECPFNLLYCLRDFASEKDWVEHSLTHFNTENRVVGPPKCNRCCFCDTQFEDSNALKSWGERMQHVRLHHQLGHRLAIARPDFELFKYLYDNRLISDADYKDFKGHSKERYFEYCDLKGIVIPGRSSANNLSLSPPMSPESPRDAVVDMYSPSRSRRDRDRARS